MVEEDQEILANLLVSGLELGVVGGGGSAVDQARRRKTPGSGELEPARLGPIAPLGLGEGERNLG